MSVTLRLTIFLAIILASLVSSAPTASPTSIAKDEYIIETIGSDPASVINEIFLAVLNDDDGDSPRRRLQATALRGSKKIIVDSYMPRPSASVSGDDHPLNSSGRSLTASSQEFIGLIRVEDDGDLQYLRNSSKVLNIIKNDEIRLSESTSSWNLDRIDQAFGMDGQFLPSAELGRSVDIYVVDTGIHRTHSEFRNLTTGVSRVLDGASFVSGETLGASDCNSHGTHVASIAAGNTFGIARESLLVPVKIMDCAGRGNVWNVLQAVTWMLDSVRNRTKEGRLAVINLSLETSANVVIDRAVRELVIAGAFVTVAAGNLNEDACKTSPAREKSVFTVGSLSMDDSKAASSNYGKCVGVYAPGEKIMGAFPIDGKAITKSGTSMASPLVAGVAATIRERFPRYSPSRIALEITSLAAPVAVAYDQDCKGTPPSGALILQSLGARTKTSIKRSHLVLSNTVRNDFNLWSPDLVLPSLTTSRPSACFQFSAKLSKANVRAARLSVMFSTADLPLGFTSILPSSSASSPPCASKSSNWILIDSTASSTTQLRFGGSSNVQPSAAFETPQILPLAAGKAVQVSVSLQLLPKDRIRVQATYSVEGIDTIVTLVDSTQAMPKGLRNKPLKISFKGSMIGDIQLQDIEACPVAKTKNAFKSRAARRRK